MLTYNQDEIDCFKSELRQLLRKYDVAIDVQIDGDTQGLSVNLVVVDPVHCTFICLLECE